MLSILFSQQIANAQPFPLDTCYDGFKAFGAVPNTSLGIFDAETNSFKVNEDAFGGEYTVDALSLDAYSGFLYSIQIEGAPRLVRTGSDRAGTYTSIDLDLDGFDGVVEGGDIFNIDADQGKEPGIYVFSSLMPGDVFAGHLPSPDGLEGIEVVPVKLEGDGVFGEDLAFHPSSKDLAKAFGYSVYYNDGNHHLMRFEMDLSTRGSYKSVIVPIGVLEMKDGSQITQDGFEGLSFNPSGDLLAVDGLSGLSYSWNIPDDVPDLKSGVLLHEAEKDQLNVSTASCLFPLRVQAPIPVPPPVERKADTPSIEVKNIMFEIRHVTGQCLKVCLGRHMESAPDQCTEKLDYWFEKLDNSAETLALAEVKKLFKLIDFSSFFEGDSVPEGYKKMEGMLQGDMGCLGDIKSFFINYFLDKLPALQKVIPNILDELKLPAIDIAFVQKAMGSTPQGQKLEQSLRNAKVLESLTKPINGVGAMMQVLSNNFVQPGVTSLSEMLNDSLAKASEKIQGPGILPFLGFQLTSLLNSISQATSKLDTGSFIPADKIKV